MLSAKHWMLYMSSSGAGLAVHQDKREEGSMPWLRRTALSTTSWMHHRHPGSMTRIRTEVTAALAARYIRLL